MSLGTLLFSLAIAAVVAAYVARAFRRAPDDLDRVIEGWIAQEARLRAAQSATKAADICPHCGRPVEPGHRFCRGCGAALAKEVET